MLDCSMAKTKVTKTIQWLKKVCSLHTTKLPHRRHRKWKTQFTIVTLYDHECLIAIKWVSHASDRSIRGLCSIFGNTKLLFAQVFFSSLYFHNSVVGAQVFFLKLFSSRIFSKFFSTSIIVIQIALKENNLKENNLVLKRENRHKNWHFKKKSILKKMINNFQWKTSVF